MSLLKKAGVPAVTIDPSTSVMHAVSRMQREKVDILFVVEKDAVLGAFSQRDLAFRVVLGRRDPETTTVRDVMTTPAITLPASATVADALRVMAEFQVAQLPVVKEESIRGMVTLREIFREQTVDLTQELDSLVAYHSADGIGG